MSRAQGSELIGICQRVAANAAAYVYDNGLCAFCSDAHTPESFPFCVACAETPEQVEGVTVPFIRLYHAVTDTFVGEPPAAPVKRRADLNSPAWEAWDAFAVSIGEEPGGYGTRTLEEYSSMFPQEWAVYQSTLDSIQS